MVDAHVDLLPPGEHGNNTEGDYVVLRRCQVRPTVVDVFTEDEARQLYERLGAQFDSKSGGSE